MSDHEGSMQEQLERAARDLWSMIVESGEDFIVFMDRRRLNTRVALRSDGMYGVSWELEDGSWIDHTGEFQSPREAAFHGYQGPH